MGDENQGRAPDNFDYHFNPENMTPQLQAICSSALPVSDKDYRTAAKVLGLFCKESKPASLFMTTYVRSVTFNFANTNKKFLDMHNGKIVNYGNDTLYGKVYDWVINNRTSRSESEDNPKRRKRAEASLSLLHTAPAMNDFVACNEAKEKLKSIFQLQRGDAIEIRELMKTSYPLQRNEINDQDKEALVHFILNEWPFIYHPLGADVHFLCGSEIDANKALNKFLDREIQLLKLYLIHKNGAKMAKYCLYNAQQTRDPRGVKMVLILAMLASHFNEDITKIFVMVPEAEQIPNCGEAMAQHVPKTPCLLGTGTNPCDCSSFYLMINCVRVAGPYTALQGLRVLFPLHFILSIDYNLDLKKTCQFYERFIMDCPPVYKVLGEVSKTISQLTRFKAEAEL